MEIRPIALRPTAWLPVLMSLAALGLVLQHIVRFGLERQADEGAAAHLFQLLIVLQLPLIALFAISSLPRAPREAGLVLIIQALAIAGALAAIFYLGW